MTIPSTLLKTAKTRFDLTEPADQHSLYALTQALLEVRDLSLEHLRHVARQEDTPLEFKLAAKLVRSRRFMLANTQPIKIGVVFAMWGEQNRLYPKSDDNPNGEDSLRVKLQQLVWVTQGTTVDWKLYAVDDGCPYRSGDIAAEIAANDPQGSRAKVLHLAQAVPVDDGPLTGLPSADASQKGGAIILGCLEALNDGVDAVIYTDTDNSVHLGQIGLLLQKHIENQTRVVLGNRKDPEAVLVKQEARWGVGIKLLRHMQRMLGAAIFSRGIRDTQAAFKLYERTMLQEILKRRTVFDFSFDTDWILATIALNEPYETVPFAFIDSFAESASLVQGPMTTWETLLKGLVTQVRAHQIPHNEAMARVLDEEIRTAADLELLINRLPPELGSASGKNLGNPEVMSPEAVQAWIQQCKKEAPGT